MTLHQRLTELLATVEAPFVYPEDFCVFDYANSNVDDAYELGLDHGRRQMAQDIRNILEAFEGLA